MERNDDDGKDDMPSIAEMARITASGGWDDAEAYALWLSVISECKRDNAEMRAGRYVYRKSFMGHIRRLWPTLSWDDATRLSKELYAQLRNTGNAQCVHLKDPPVWSVSPEWRTPNKEEAQQVTATTAPVSDFILHKQQEREARLELMVEMVERLGQPVTAAELAHEFEIHDTTVGYDVRELVKRGKFFKRLETMDERAVRFGEPVATRPSYLYSTVDPVPARTKRIVVDGFVAQYAGRPEPKIKVKVVTPAASTATEATVNAADQVRLILAENSRLRSKVEELRNELSTAIATIRELSQPRLPADVERALAEWSPSA